MLKENEKRTFWIVVMAVAVVSLVAAWASSFIVSVNYMIYGAEDIGEYASDDFAFSIALFLLVVFIAVAAAVAHLATKGRNSAKAKIVWASVIGGFVLLTSILFTVVYYCVDEVSNITTYQALMNYITNTLAILVSYETAFLAQMMLLRKPKQSAAETTSEPAESNPQE